MLAQRVYGLSIGETGRWLEPIVKGNVMDVARKFVARKQRNKRAFSVEGDTLDNTAKERVDLVKMDIQGMEFEAPKGAKRILSKSKPILLIEIHSSHFWRFEELVEFIHRYGCNYSVERIEKEGPILFLLASELIGTISYRSFLVGARDII